MCGRYFIHAQDTPEEMQAILDALNRRQTPARTGDVSPGDAAAVIAPTKRLSPAPFRMRWGYGGQGGQLIINARSETAALKPLFADGMRRRRCLIPACGYYEWTRRSREKTKYAMTDPGLPLLYMAGLYRIGERGAEFTILTRSPGEEIAFLHDRMPVILPPSCFSAWLSPDADAALVLSMAKTQLSFSPAPGEAPTLSFLDDLNRLEA